MNIMANSEPIAITLQKICNRSLHHSVVYVCGYHYYSLHQVPIIRKLACPTTECVRAWLQWKGMSQPTRGPS